MSIFDNEVFAFPSQPTVGSSVRVDLNNTMLIHLLPSEGRADGNTCVCRCEALELTALDLFYQMSTLAHKHMSNVDSISPKTESISIRLADLKLDPTMRTLPIFTFCSCY